MSELQCKNFKERTVQMNRNLIIITDEYPYGRGETFIENERPYWRKFDHVYICPVLCSASSTIRPNFQCKENETLIDDVKDKKIFADFFGACFGQIGFRHDSQEIKDGEVLKQKPKELFRRLVVMERARLRTNVRINKIYKKLKTLLRGDCKNYIYAYWMFEPAIVGTGLKSIIPTERLVSRAHGYDLYEYRHKNQYIPFRKYTMDNIDRICPISEDGVKYLHTQYSGRYDPKISVERLGTIKLFDIEEQHRPEHPVIVSCSNLVALKRVNLIIKALAKCNQKVEWHHFGDGTQEATLKQEAQKLPNNISVTFHGRVPNQEVQRFYASHCITALVNVSETEGIPVSIMEAGSYGIPAIATDVGGTHEIVHDGLNGLLLKKDFSDEELLNAINIVFSNIERFREESTKVWEQLCDATTNYRDFFMKEFRV